MMYNFKEKNYTTERKIGFTLAEVLITLAIIGVVAVLTIPTLVANYQEKGWNTAAIVFERKLEESLKVMNTQGTLAGYKNTEDFVDELSKHLKINKICKNDDLMSCFEDKVMWGAGESEPTEVDMTKVKTAKNFGQDDWDTNIVGIQLANGTTGLVAYNPECSQDQYSNQIKGTSCLAILYDTSAFKNPNTIGKDLRSINVASLGGKDCAFEVNGNCFGVPFFPDMISQSDCEAIADDLGLRKNSHCNSRGSYWVGAVKQCGHKSKLATPAQILDIARYIYNTDDLGSDITMDEEKAASLGFNVYFYGLPQIEIWSNSDVNQYSNITTYTFSKEYITSGATYPYNGNDKQAICVLD